MATYRFDVLDPAAMKRAIGECAARFGRLDTVVVSAGIVSHRQAPLLCYAMLGERGRQPAPARAAAGCDEWRVGGG